MGNKILGDLLSRGFYIFFLKYIYGFIRLFFIYSCIEGKK